MPFVLDASAALEAAFDDESGAVGALVMDRLARDEAYVPPIWFGEVVHGVLQGVRRGRVPLAGAHRMLAGLAECPISLVPDHAESRAVLDAAHRTGLSAYDASYLLLAVDTGLELATCDRRLRAAAEQAGVACF